MHVQSHKHTACTSQSERAASCACCSICFLSKRYCMESCMFGFSSPCCRARTSWCLLVGYWRNRSVHRLEIKSPACHCDEALTTAFLIVQCSHCQQQKDPTQLQTGQPRSIKFKSSLVQAQRGPSDMDIAMDIKSQPSTASLTNTRNC